MKRIVGFLLGCLILSSCNVSFMGDSICKTDDEENNNHEVAEKYVRNLIEKDNMYYGRSVTEDSVPDFFYEMEIEDENGNFIDLSKLTESEKLEYLQMWESCFIDDIEMKLNNNTELVDIIIADNDAFDEAKKMNRKRSLKTLNDEILNSYIKKLCLKYECENNSRCASDATNKIKKVEFGTNVTSSVDVLKNNYVRGRVLYNVGAVGHTSMLCSETFDNTWYKGGIAKATITSFPNNSKVRWEGQINGMQYEPIEYWCGNSDGSADIVMILDVRGVSYKLKTVLNTNKNNFISYTTKLAPVYKNSTKSERKTAINVANKLLQNNVKYVPKDENLSYIPGYIQYKNSDKYSYCSQVVWKSWKANGSKFDMSPIGLWVAPIDIVAAQQTTVVTKYINKK